MKMDHLLSLAISLVVLCLLFVGSHGVSRRRNVENAFVSIDGETTIRSNGKPTVNKGEHSYLLTNDSSVDVQFVKLMVQKLHEQQHPPKESCRHRRLLVTQFEQVFEGFGSIMKVVLLGLAEAAHSNRTLVWGLDLPFLFENSRDEWYSSSSSSKNKQKNGGQIQRKVKIRGIEFDCSSGNNGVYDGSGPYGCFFMPLSSCGVQDVTVAELLQLGIKYDCCFLLPHCISFRTQSTRT